MTTPKGPNVVVFPPLAFFGSVMLAAVLQWAAPVNTLPPFWSPVPGTLGVVVMFLAIALAVWGSQTFQKAGTNVSPRQPALKLVRNGPYRFTRNPMYLGMVLFQPGLALALSFDWSLPLTFALWSLLDRGVVVREEAYLTGLFGEEYEHYLADTRRWL